MKRIFYSILCLSLILAGCSQVRNEGTISGKLYQYDEVLDYRMFSTNQLSDNRLTGNRINGTMAFHFTNGIGVLDTKAKSFLFYNDLGEVSALPYPYDTEPVQYKYPVGNIAFFTLMFADNKVYLDRLSLPPNSITKLNEYPDRSKTNVIQFDFVYSTGDSIAETPIAAVFKDGILIITDEGYVLNGVMNPYQEGKGVAIEGTYFTYGYSDGILHSCFGILPAKSFPRTTSAP